MEMFITEIKEHFSTKQNSKNKIRMVDNILGEFIKKSESVKKSYVQIGVQARVLEDNPYLSKLKSTSVTKEIRIKTTTKIYSTYEAKFNNYLTPGLQNLVNFETTQKGESTYYIAPRVSKLPVCLPIGPV